MRVFKMLMVCCCCILLAGCWDRIELNDVSIVTGFAVDKGKEKRFKVTLEAIIPSQFTIKSSGDATPVTTYTLEGDTIAEAVRKMNIGLSRKLILSHTRVLYISEEIARDGMIEFLDYLDRSGEFRNDFNIVITRGASAETFTKITYPLQKIPSLKIHKQAQSFVDEWGGEPSVRLTDFIAAVTATGKAAVAATVEIEGDPKKGQKMENNQSTRVDAMVVMQGMGVFDQDKLVGFLSLDDTRNYIWTQKLKQTSFSMPCGKSKEEKDKFSAFRVLLSHPKLKVELVNGKPILKVKITGEAKLETTQCKIDLTQIASYEELEKEINHYIEGEIRGTIEKVQKEFGEDIFGFGEAFNRQHHKQYKKVEVKWDKEFAKADVQVQVDMHLRRSGVRGSSFISDIPKEE